MVESEWLRELQNDEEYGIILENLKANRLEEEVKLVGMAKRLGVADFMIEEGALKLLREDWTTAVVVPKSKRKEVFTVDVSQNISRRENVSNTRKEGLGLPWKRTLRKSRIRLSEIDLDDYKTKLVRGMRVIRDEVAQQAEKYRERMKKYYDSEKAVDKSYFPKVGERVFMKMPRERSHAKHPKLVLKSCCSHVALMSGMVPPGRSIQSHHLARLAMGYEQESYMDGTWHARWNGRRHRLWCRTRNEHARTVILVPDVLRRLTFCRKGPRTTLFYYRSFREVRRNNNVLFADEVGTVVWVNAAEGT
ncbi:hypothetical protein OSTOST_11138 [Ostertagia ostertagi]